MSNIIGDRYIILYPTFYDEDTVSKKLQRKTGIEILRASDIVAIYFEQEPNKSQADYEKYVIHITWLRKDKSRASHCEEIYDSIDELEKRMLEIKDELNGVIR